MDLTSWCSFVNTNCVSWNQVSSFRRQREADSSDGDFVVVSYFFCFKFWSAVPVLLLLPSPWWPLRGNDCLFTVRYGEKQMEKVGGKWFHSLGANEVEWRREVWRIFTDQHHFLLFTKKYPPVLWNACQYTRIKLLPSSHIKIYGFGIGGRNRDSCSVLQ